MRFALLLLSIYVSGWATEPFDLRQAAADPQVLALFQDLALRGAHQVDEHEVAAFIVRDPNGAISSVPWPHVANRRSERYDGVVPAGTVAIAHTHPIFLERPSRGDIEEAKRIGMPIYVITRWNLYVVDSAGITTALIAQKNWARSSKPVEIRAGRESRLLR